MIDSQMIFFATAPIAFAMGDRFCGGGMGWNPAWKGRPIYYMGPLIIFYCLSYQHGILGLAWVFWRSFAWKAIFNACINPQNRREFLALSARHCAFLLTPFLAWYTIVEIFFQMDLSSLALRSVLFVASFSIISALYGLFWGKMFPKKDLNSTVEWSRGMLYGSLCVFFFYLW